MIVVAIVPPSGDPSVEGLFVWDTAARTLIRENGKFEVGHVEPTSKFGGVAPFELFGETTRLGAGKTA